jgi:hypothetical protein
LQIIILICYMITKCDINLCHRHLNCLCSTPAYYKEYLPRVISNPSMHVEDTGFATPKCDLDVWAADMRCVCYTPFHHSENLYQIILYSFKDINRTNPDTRTDTHSYTEKYMSIVTTKSNTPQAARQSFLNLACFLKDNRNTVTE